MDGDPELLLHGVRYGRGGERRHLGGPCRPTPSPSARSAHEERMTDEVWFLPHSRKQAGLGAREFQPPGSIRITRAARRGAAATLTLGACAVTVAPMWARWRVPLPLLLLAAVIVLAAARPVSAHPASRSVLADSSLATVSPSPFASLLPGLTAAPPPPALSWPLLVGAVVAAVAARRRRRAVVALPLALLLGIFAFENALHSVHHGLEPAGAKGCAIAAASAHLAATTVDSVTEADPVSPASEDRVLAPELTGPLCRVKCPDQGRAPPA